MCAKPYNGSLSWSKTAHRGDAGSILGRPYHVIFFAGEVPLRKVFSEYCSFLPSVSFQKCYILLFNSSKTDTGRSQWPCSLRRRYLAARLLRSWLPIPPGTWMFVCCECCVLSGRGFCDGLTTRLEESYRPWRVVVCDQEISKTRRRMSATGLWKIQPQWVVTPGKQTNKRNRHCLILTTESVVENAPLFY
jgi:hypothetical protein